MKNLIFVLLLLTSTLVCAAEELPQFATRNLMIFFDTSERIIKESFETGQADAKPFGAITEEALAAISQKAGPILITQTCLRNCVLPSLVKRDFTKLSPLALQNRYPFITQSNYLTFGNAIANPGSVKRAYRTFMEAALINFNYWDWVIRKVLKNIDGTIKPSDDVYVLIPRTYLPELQDYVNSSPSQTKTTDLEYQLGIKIDHMGPTSEAEFEKTIYTNTLTSREEILEGFDESLFFTLNTEYAKANKSDQIPQWAIYLTGHGLGTKTQAELGQLQQTEYNAQQLHDIVQKYIDQVQQIYPDSLEDRLQSYNKKVFRDSLQSFLELIKKINNELQKDFPFNFIITLVENNIKSLEEELKKGEIKWEYPVLDTLFAFNQQKVLVESLYEEKLGTIAGIPLLAFQEFLDFLDIKINTQFLFFSTCYAGGRNLQLLYQESLQKMQGRTYSYIIASDAFTDAPTGIRPFTVSNDTIKFSMNFKDFFDIINNLHKRSVTDKKPFKQLIEQALVNLKRFDIQAQLGKVTSIPNLKFPGLEFTQVPNLPEIVSIGQILTATRDPKKQLNLQKFFKTKTPPNVVLLYTPIIPFSIQVTKPTGLLEEISFVSMTPGKLGKAYHIFEELDAQEFTPDELARAFLNIEKLTSEKVFWIKQAKFKNNEIIKDIFLVYNADNIGPTPMAYYTDNNTPYSAQWDHEQNKLINETRDDGYKKRWKKYLRDTFGPNYEQPTKTFEKIRELLKGRGKTPEEEKARLERKQIDQKLKNLAQALQSLARSQ